MTTADFKKQVLAVQCMPNAVIRYIASIADELDDAAKEGIVGELDRGERDARRIVDDGMIKLSSIIRKVKKRRRTDAEQGDRVRNTLPQL